jgi:hypothetical protein
MPGLSSGARQGYAVALTGLWSRLSRSLAELEAIAADPDELLVEETLPVLAEARYALHATAELAVGIDPPAGGEAAHVELAAALADARDATADIAEAVELGGTTAAEPLLPEWRGALFRVRLARLRASTPRPLPADPAHATDRAPSFSRTALTAVLLVIVGAAAFAGGATLALWPLWAVGLGLFASGLLIYRPRP